MAPLFSPRLNAPPVHLQLQVLECDISWYSVLRLPKQPAARCRLVELKQVDLLC
jgi:hypothetical protein